MADAETATVTADTNPLDVGTNLYRLFVLDVDTDLDDPQLRVLYKRGGEYPDVQSRARKILAGDGADGDFLYMDVECTTKFEAGGEEGEPKPSWNLVLVRKQKGQAAKKGVDREWIKMVLSNNDLSEAEKLARLAKFLG